MQSSLHLKFIFFLCIGFSFLSILYKHTLTVTHSLAPIQKGFLLLDIEQSFHRSSHRNTSREGINKKLHYYQLPKHPQLVYLRPSLRGGIQLKGELKHFVLDGIKRSKFLNRTTDENDETAVWLIVANLFPCDRLWNKVQTRIKLQQTKNNNGIVEPWRIFILDYNDLYTPEYHDCIRDIPRLFNSSDYVHYAARMHVDGRNLTLSSPSTNDSEPFHNLGRPWIYPYQGKKWINGIVRVNRYGVRSDLVKAIETIQRDNNAPTRSIDVSHFWRAGDDDINGRHRSTISKALEKMRDSYNLNIIADNVGERRKIGRNSVSRDYATTLLQSKIVVVSQRDYWEDHYRLMEGLAGGSLVFTDPMHPLPLHIKDGESVIVYNSIEELRTKILYYLNNEKERLQIAVRGYSVAMNEHRSHHLMERLVFGDWTKPHGVEE